MNDTQSDNRIPLIDVEQVFASKDPKMLKRIPKFIIRYLKRIIHQDEINEFLTQNQGVTGFEFIARVIDYMGVKVRLVGLENVPRDKRLIFASNHPLGGLDGMCLLDAVHRQLQPNPKSVSNDLLMNLKPLRTFMIGVNKHGGNSKESVAEMQRAFEGNDPLIFFPAGLVSRRKWFKIRDLVWKSTFVKKAFLHERDIVPVYITGRVSGFFYGLANLRTFLRIRNNIEMLYLPHEMFKQRGRELTIRFGEPIPWRSFNSSKSPEQWAADIKKKVYGMARNS